VKGIPDIRLRIQCANVYDHAKILPIQSFLDMAPDLGIQIKEDNELKLYFARRIGEIICGDSMMYVYQPADRSPMGRCVLCGGALSFEIQDQPAKSGPRELAAYHSQQSEAPRGRRKKAS
jgi:hypothetical protein